MTRRHVHAALGLLLLALLGGCAAPGPSPEALTELTFALEDSEQSGEARLAELLLRYPDHLPLLDLALAHSEAQGDQEGRLRYARAAFFAALGAGLSPDALEVREQALLDALRAPPAPAPASPKESASADDPRFQSPVIIHVPYTSHVTKAAASSSFMTSKFGCQEVRQGASSQSQRNPAWPFRASP